MAMGRMGNDGGAIMLWVQLELYLGCNLNVTTCRA